MADDKIIDALMKKDLSTISLEDLVHFEDEVNGLVPANATERGQIEALKDKINQTYKSKHPGNREYVHKIRTGFPVEHYRYDYSSSRHSNGWQPDKGWKFHLDVVPNRNHPVTKEVSDFLISLDVHHKIASGGQNGKGMTVYVGSYDDVVRLATEIQERFGDKIPVPPFYTDQVGQETPLTSIVYARFVPGDSHYSTYPATNVGVGLFKDIMRYNTNTLASSGDDARLGVESSMSLKSLASLNQAKKMFFPESNAPSWGRFIPTYRRQAKDAPDAPALLFEYCHHKLFTKHIGQYYYGSDLDAFEAKIFGDRLPPKGSKERADWDQVATLFEQDVKNYDKEKYHDENHTLNFLTSFPDGYMPVDFKKLEQENASTLDSKTEERSVKIADDKVIDALMKKDLSTISLEDLVHFEDAVNGLVPANATEQSKIEVLRHQIANKYQEMKNSPDIGDLRFKVHEIRTGYKTEAYATWEVKHSVREDNGWNGNNGWKIHLDVVPNRNHPVTKELSDFLLSLDVDHKIAHGGENGKGMTVYIGSYADAVRLSKEIQERFGDKISVPPAYTDQVGQETSFEKVVFGRFVPGPKRGQYPLTDIGIGLLDVEQTSNLQGEILWGSSRSKEDIEKGVVENAYCHHKLYAKLLGSYYYGDDLDAFEKKFFGDRLPPKGSKERAQLDAVAETFENEVKTNSPSFYASIQNLSKGYMPVDFKKLEQENTATLDSKTEERSVKMAERVYTKEDLKKYIDAMEDAAKATDNVNDFMNIQAFAEEDLLAFVNGDIDITPDAFDTMEKFIETFTGGYSDERIKKLHDQAVAKLNRRIEEEKAKLATAKSGNDGNDGGNTQSAGEPTGPDHSNGASKNDDNDEKHKTAQSLEEIVYGRLRSPYSDINDFYLDSFKMEVLHDMGKISDKDFQDAQNAGTAEAAIETLNKVEPKLKENEKQDMENRLTDKILAATNVFETIPPKRLALMYDNVKERYQTAQNPTERQKLKQAYDKLAERIDQLSEMLAKKQHLSDDLFFADCTNIADCYDGYMQMFQARLPDLGAMAKNPSTKAEAQAKLDHITEGKKVLQAHIDDYDKTWSLDAIRADKAPDLDERFDVISKNLKKAEIDDQTLALVSNMKFLDESGNVEPQFVDASGQKSDVYTQGAKIIKGSKLEEAILLAKQQVLLDNLGVNTAVEPADLSKALSKALPETLYAIYVADKTANGALEDQHQFTDPNKLKDFVADLGNTSKPMPISHKGFEAAKNALVNQTGAYASRLKQKLGKDTAVVSKLFEPVQEIDQRANGRTEKMNPWKARKILAGRLALSGASAFGVSFALTTLGTAASTDAALTAATGGLNKVVGAALGVGLGTVATITTIRKWRKAQKEAGQKANFKAFIKNPQLVATVATTALGAAAVGFAATGNPGVASVLGASAMTIGTTNGVISNTKRAKEMGLSTTEAAIWGVLQAGVNLGAGFGGRAAGMGFVDYINNHTDLNWFKHEEMIEPGWKEPGKETKVYHEDAIPGAQKVLNEFYRGNPDAMQADLESVRAQLQAMGRTDIPPERFLMEAIDAKMNTGVDTVLHVQGGENVHTHGNHFVFTDRWAAEHGVSTDAVKALGGIRGADGAIHLTPEAIKGFEAIDGHVGIHNTIGHTTGAGFQNDGVLGKNAAMIDGRQTVVDTGADRFATYADGDSAFKIVKGPDIDHPPVFGMVENPKTPMLGMLGVYSPKILKKLKPREGSLADKIIKKVIRKKLPYEPPTVTVIDNGKPPYEPPTVTVIDRDPKKTMIDEYKIVYGIEPNQESYDAYYKRVEKERVKEAPDLSMYDYLLLRRKQLDEFVDTNLGVLKEAQLGNAFAPVKCKADYMRRAIQDTRSGAVIIGQARESLMKSNLTHENFTGAITLTHFKKYLGHYIAQDVMVADGTRDFTQNPTLKTNGDRIEIYDLNAYLVEGKTKGESNIEGRDGASIPLADIKLLRQRTKEEIEQGIYPKLDLEAIKNREERLGKLAKEQRERDLAKEKDGRE